MPEKNSSIDPLDVDTTIPANGANGADQSVGSIPTRRERRRFRDGALILGRYRVTGELGQGGMGVVYRCHDETGKIDVALKALPPELSHNTVEMEEVLENFRLVSRLSHENIAQIRTLERDPSTGDYYLVMECVEGINLRQWRKRNAERGTRSAEGGRAEHVPGTLSTAAILPALRQIAAALDYAHRQKIMHRDIKPSNVMVRADGTAKVLDFGLAAQIHTSFSRVSRVKYDTSGTGPYMAPEQWEGEYQGAATDQYALAAMSYELLAGRCPFEGHDTAVLREAVLNAQVKPVPGVSLPAMEALKRGLAKESAERFGNCSEFVEALAGGGDASPRRPSGKLLLRLTAAAVLVCVLAAVGWLSYRSYQSYSARRQAERRAAEEQAQLDGEEQARIARMTSEAESALAAGDLKTADKTLAELEAVGTAGPAVRDLRRRIEKNASERETNQRYAEASVARDRMVGLNLDRGQGFGEKLDGLEVSWRAAEAARGKESWGEALTVDIGEWALEPLFKIVKGTGDCAVKVPDDADFVGVQEEKAYPYGTKVKTGEEASAVVVFSEGNECRVLSDACVTITEDEKDKKLKIIKLDQGKVEVELRKEFHEHNKLDVETAVATCSAMGSKLSIDSRSEQDIVVVVMLCKDGKMKVLGPNFDVPLMDADDMLSVSSSLDKNFTRIKNVSGGFAIGLKDSEGNPKLVDSKPGATVKIWRKASEDAKALVVTILITDHKGEIQEAITYNMNR